MSWTVSYSYGTISNSENFQDELEARHFYEIIRERIEEFGNNPNNEYISQAEIKED